MGSRSLHALALLAGLLVLPSIASAAPPASTPAQAPSKSTTPGAKSATGASRANGSSSDAVVRQRVAGGPTYDDGAMGADTPELRALYAAERELFPPASPAVGTP